MAVSRWICYGWAAWPPSTLRPRIMEPIAYMQRESGVRRLRAGGGGFQIGKQAARLRQQRAAAAAAIEAAAAEGQHSAGRRRCHGGVRRAAGGWRLAAGASTCHVIIGGCGCAPAASGGHMQGKPTRRPISAAPPRRTLCACRARSARHGSFCMP